MENTKKNNDNITILDDINYKTLTIKLENGKILFEGKYSDLKRDGLIMESIRESILNNH